MKRKTQKTISVFITLLLVLLLPVQAFAQEYDLANGTVSVTAKNNEQYVSQGSIIDEKQTSETVITGTSNPNTITIEAEAGQTANVTLKDVNIDCSGIYGSAALITSGDGDVNIELDGNNMLASGAECAGLNKENTGSLTISDDDNNGSLEATGGRYGAGIGGGDSGNGSNITITGGTVAANGGDTGAGIGGGYMGDGSDITISGGTVTANGGDTGAGIGGGDDGDGSNITISGGTVTANGGDAGAGIGGGNSGKGNDIMITGGTVTANGGSWAAGIGGGNSGDGSNITITGGTATANGGNSGAGIGGGDSGDGSNITIAGGTVTASGGDSGAGIGGGNHGDGNDITISGGTVTATGETRGAGIGGGWNGSASGISISGGSVTAIGDSAGAGIGSGGGGLGSVSDVSVSGYAQVRVQGGETLGGLNYGTGAGIGNGGSYDYTNSLIDGAELEPDVSSLTAPGWIKYYAPGANMDTDAPIRVIFGKAEPPKPEPEPYNAPADSAYKIGETVIINGTAWIVIGIEGDVLELASFNAFSEEQLKDLENLIKNIFTTAQLEKLIFDKASGERVFLANEDVADEYFGGEAGHIVIKADISILD